MKEILVLSENKNWKSEITELFKKDNENHPIKAVFVSSRTDIISELSIRYYDAIVMNSGLPISNLQIIFKYLASTELKNSPIFFISENISDFDELLAQTQFPKLELIPAPVESELVAKNIQSVLYPSQAAKGPVDSEVKINLEFLKTFIDATKYVLRSFCQINNIKHSRPYLYNPQTAKKFDIEGQIRLKSDFFEGQFIIGFDKAAYIKIINVVIGLEDKEINKTNEDFVGEIVNMIYGQAKTVLNLTGYKFDKVIPTYTVNPPKYETKNPIVVVPLTTETGLIEILVEIASIKNQN